LGKTLDARKIGASLHGANQILGIGSSPPFPATKPLWRIRIRLGRASSNCSFGLAPCDSCDICDSFRKCRSCRNCRTYAYAFRDPEPPICHWRSFLRARMVRGRLETSKIQPCDAKIAKASSASVFSLVWFGPSLRMSRKPSRTSRLRLQPFQELCRLPQAWISHPCLLQSGSLSRACRFSTMVTTPAIRAACSAALAAKSRI
jgi:hypothetical protein